MASIDRRGPQSFRIRWRLGGRADGPMQSVTAADEKRAKVVKAYVEAQGSRVTDEEVYLSSLFPQPERPVGMPLLSEWIPTWRQRREVHGDIQADTLKRYFQLAERWIVPFLGDYHLDTIKRELVTKWLGWLRTQTSSRGLPLSPDSIHHLHALLHQILGAAVPEHIPGNPVARPVGTRKSTPGLPKKERFPAVFLEPWEAELLIEAAEGQMRDLIVVALWSGLRLGELLVLRVQDVDLRSAQPTIHVTRALKTSGVIGEPKSERSRRAVSVEGRAVKVLARLVAGRRRNALVFPSPTGRVWSETNLGRRKFKPAVGAAQRCTEHPPPPPPKPRAGPSRGWRFDEVSTCECPTRLHVSPRFHDLRHTHASWLIAVGEEMFQLSRRLGHEKISTTFDIYGHLRPAGDAGKLRAMDDLLPEQDGEDPLDEAA